MAVNQNIAIDETGRPYLSTTAKEKAKGGNDQVGGGNHNIINPGTGGTPQGPEAPGAGPTNTGMNSAGNDPKNPGPDQVGGGNHGLLNPDPVTFPHYNPNTPAAPTTPGQPPAPNAGPYNPGGTVAQISNINTGFMGAGTTGQAGQIDPATGEQYEATTRQVQDNELVANQLDGLLSSDSRYMAAARRTGLAQANARGGLGGTVGIGASVAAAIRSGLPIATADAQAYRDAASQNMNALNQFGLANMQRSTQIATANLDAATRVQMTAMNNANQAAISKLNSLTQISVANLDAQTQTNVARMNNEFQERLANIQFMQSEILNEQQHGYAMEQDALRGEYGLAEVDARAAAELEMVERQTQVTRESTYADATLGAYQAYITGIQSLNGNEMDQAARDRAEASLRDSYYAQIDLLNLLYEGQIQNPVVPDIGG